MAQEYFVTFSGEDVKELDNVFPNHGAPKVTVIINQYWDKDSMPADQPKEQTEE